MEKSHKLKKSISYLFNYSFPNITNINTTKRKLSQPVTCVVERFLANH